jgi:hypothetical protein
MVITNNESADNSVGAMGLATQGFGDGSKMSVAEFKKIMRKNGFADAETIARRRISASNWMEFEFEMITKHSLNIGNLIDIERKHGLALCYVGPLPDGQMKVVFSKLPSLWRRLR